MADAVKAPIDYFEIGYTYWNDIAATGRIPNDSDCPAIHMRDPEQEEARGQVISGWAAAKRDFALAHVPFV